jgi:hypothetical protein
MSRGALRNTMSTRSKFLSWSKKGRQSTSEPYHRTGGLLPIAIIDVDSSVSLEGSEELPANDTKVRCHLGERMRCHQMNEARRVDVVVQDQASRMSVVIPCRGGCRRSAVWSVFIR